MKPKTYNKKKKKKLLKDASDIARFNIMVRKLLTILPPVDFWLIQIIMVCCNREFSTLINFNFIVTWK